MTFIYHDNCCDGFCAAWLANFVWPDATFIPAQPNWKVPDVEGQDVIIADFSYPRDILTGMAQAAKSIKVFDHHATAEKELAGLDFCTFDKDKSGASLIYNYLTSQGLLKPSHMHTWLVRYVEDRDLWKKQLPYCDEVHAALVSYDYDFQSWNTIAAKGVAAIKEEGVHILRSQHKFIAQTLKRLEWVEINGLRGKGVHYANGLSTSEILGKVLQDDQSLPFAVMWGDNVEGTRLYSIRSRKESGVDVGAIARQYGGGGHTNSASFRVKATTTLDVPIQHSKIEKSSSQS
jgi:oligoribonuclease NrnB/cAMP/cGMP phosphodiesterase (DHH superfamily)